jgi:putative spermidine/putrescine transport system ATP-binding protein
LAQPPAVEIKGASKRFGDVVALEEVSLEIRRGEFFALLGPSGCGKTTLLRMIGGFDEPTSGTVLVGGKDLGNVPPNRRPVNMVFQQYALFPHLTVGENVAFGLRYKGVARADETRRVAEVLELVKLSGFERRKPHQLSGGQRQRVALARALVLSPEVLLLDEPLGALDQKLRKEVQVQLKTLQRTLGITFVFVTHDQEEALTMSDRIAVMSRGRVEQLDEAAAVYERPATEFVADFMGAPNFFGPAAARFVVRPEKLRLAERADEGLASRPVTVAERIYHGATTVWTVTAEDGARYVVSRQNEGADPGHPPGARAALTWRREHEVPLRSAAP